MNNKLTHSSTTLQQLKHISIAMLKLAEQGEWDEVLSHDKKRLMVLQDQTGKVESANSNTDRQLKNDIIQLDESIKKLAHDKRKAIMETELRQQAQLAAQTSYKLALASGTGQ